MELLALHVALKSNHFLLNGAKLDSLHLEYSCREDQSAWSEYKGKKGSFYPSHLALARDGLVEQQAAAVLLLQAGVLRPRRANPSPAGAEGLKAVGGQRRRRRGRVGLVAGGRPAPVAPRGAVAGGGEGTGGAVVFP